MRLLLQETDASKRTLIKIYISQSIYLYLASPEVKRRVVLITATVILYNFCALHVPGHHVRGGAVDEVGEVHILLVQEIFEKVQANDVVPIHPRPKFYITLLLILKRQNL